MPLIMCHSPKGGIGTSFVAAGLAQGLSALGRDVVALDMTAQDSLKFYFGLAPGHVLPEFSLEHGVVEGDRLPASGVALKSAYRTVHEPEFLPALRAGKLGIDRETVIVADVASTDRALAQALLPHALLHICPLAPSAMMLAQMPAICAGRTFETLNSTVFVLNQMDETRRFARQASVFLRELLGVNLVAQITLDESVNEAVGMRQTLSRYAPASASLAGLHALVAMVDRRCAVGVMADPAPIPVHRPESKSAAA